MINFFFSFFAKVYQNNGLELWFCFLLGFGTMVKIVYSLLRCTRIL